MAAAILSKLSHPALFLFYPDIFFVCALHSFGRQLGGRRGCECLILEPSEMIVVSIDAVLCCPFYFRRVLPFPLFQSSSLLSSCSLLCPLILVLFLIFDVYILFHFILLPYIPFLFYVVLLSLPSLQCCLNLKILVHFLKQFPLEAV